MWPHLSNSGHAHLGPAHRNPTISLQRSRLFLEALEDRVVPAFPPVLPLNDLGPLGLSAQHSGDNAFAGVSTSGAGDVNGDGFGDLLIGAPGVNAGGTDRGEAYVVFGEEGLEGGSRTLNAFDPGILTLRGFEDNAYAGASVSGAGDVNGDGFDDLLIGAYGTDAGGTSRGEAYVVFGEEGLGGSTLPLSGLGTRGFTLEGFEDDANAGRNVSGAGDLNDDGFDDILVSAPSADAEGVDRGEVYVVFGGDDLEEETLSLNALGPQGWTLEGFEDDAQAGAGVSGAGDINDDGFDDLIIGAPFSNADGTNRGEVYALFGGEELEGTTLTLNAIGSQGFTLTGFEDDATAGSSVSGAGDFNNDGFDDVLIGAPLTDVEGSNRGEAYVIFGEEGLEGDSIPLDALSGQGLTLQGIENDANAGLSVSGAGDVDGDGSDDLLIGLPFSDIDPPGSDHGEAFVVFGDENLEEEVDGDTFFLGLGLPGLILRGFEGDATAGASVNEAGDINGDGIDDLILGAPYTDKGGVDRGEAYLILGQDNQPPSANLDSAPDVNRSSNPTQYDFVVTFTDNGKIDASSLDDNDIAVVRRGGLPRLPADLVSVDSSTDGSPRTATYRITPPGGDWNFEDEGTYFVFLQRNQVRDVSGIAVSSLSEAVAEQLGSFTVDLTLPRAALIDAPDVNVNSDPTQYEFRATFTDSSGIDASSLGDNDIQVSEPGGFIGLATFVSVNSGRDGAPRTATYRITPPGGTWDPADNGTYNFSVQPDEVLDVLGNPVPAGDLPGPGGDPIAFIVELTPPTATLSAAADVTDSSDLTRYRFRVTFADNSAIDVSSLDNHDLRVRAPSGFSVDASLVSVDTPGDGSPRTATYQITPPTGTWDVADNGTYTVVVQPDQVFDTTDNPLPATELGTFQVSLTSTAPTPTPPSPDGGTPAGPTSPEADGTAIGVFDPNTAMWYLRDSTTAGEPDIAPFSYGSPGWMAVVGDWDGDGIDTIGVVDPSTMTWYLRNSNSPGAPDIEPFSYGGLGWQVVVGDWNGDGTDTVGVFDPEGQWHLRNSNSAGAPDSAPFVYGLGSWTAVVGDWNGNGTDSVGVVDSTMTWYLRNTNSAGAPDLEPFTYGLVGWETLSGDWNDDGSDGMGVFDPVVARWLLRNQTNAGAPDVEPFRFGVGTWQPLTGNFL